MCLRDSPIGMYGFRMQSLLLIVPNLLVPSIPHFIPCLVMNPSYLYNLLLDKCRRVWYSPCLIVFQPCKVFLLLLKTIQSRLVRLKLSKLISIVVLWILQLVILCGLVLQIQPYHRAFHVNWLLNLLVRFWFFPRLTMCRFVCSFLIGIVNCMMYFTVLN